MMRGGRGEGEEVESTNSPTCDGWSFVYYIDKLGFCFLFTEDTNLVKKIVLTSVVDQ